MKKNNDKIREKELKLYKKEFSRVNEALRRATTSSEHMSLEVSRLYKQKVQLENRILEIENRFNWHRGGIWLSLFWCKLKRAFVPRMEEAPAFRMGFAEGFYIASFILLLSTLLESFSNYDYKLVAVLIIFGVAGITYAYNLKRDIRPTMITYDYGWHNGEQK